MRQQIIHDYPPNFAEIRERFALAGRPGVLFSYGGRLFYPKPDGLPIHPAVLAHEMVHGLRQGETLHSVMDWWRRYLEDKRFRLIEETAGHVAEYQWWMANGTRAQRRAALKQVSNRLASPLYGAMIRPSAARDLIRAGAAISARTADALEGKPCDEVDLRHIRSKIPEQSSQNF